MLSFLPYPDLAGYFKICYQKEDYYRRVIHRSFFEAPHSHRSSWRVFGQKSFPSLKFQQQLHLEGFQSPSLDQHLIEEYHYYRVQLGCLRGGLEN